jgi:hypothetical protein
MAQGNQAAIIDFQGKLVVAWDIFVDIAQIDCEGSTRFRDELKVLRGKNKTAGAGLFRRMGRIPVLKSPAESRHI